MRSITAQFKNLCVFSVVVSLIFCLCSFGVLAVETDNESSETLAFRKIEAIWAETSPTIDGKLDERNRFP